MDNSLKGKGILILGAGTWQVPWIQHACNMGLQVFVTDWSANPEGKKYAHKFEQIDLKDKEKTLQFAIENKVEAVFTSADIGVQNAAYVAEKMGLPYHTQEVAFWSTNKNAMRNRAKEIGLGIPAFASVKDLDDAINAADHFGYPVIIKPVDGFSSRGVMVLNNATDLRLFFKESVEASFTGTVLIEEFMKGTEGSVEALVHNGVPYILGICDKVKSPLPFRYDLQLNYPGNYTKIQEELIVNFIKKLVSGYKIVNGIIHVEIMVTADKVRLIEFAVRGCGSKVITHLMPATSEFDVMTWLIYAAFGTYLPINLKKNKVGILKFIMLENGIIKSITGIDKALELAGVLDCDIEKKPGDEIVEIKDGRSRPGYLLVSAKDKESLNEIVGNALGLLSVKYEA